LSERRYDMDWMRVLAMLGVFFYHCLRFFDAEGWHLKNADQSFTLFVFIHGLIWPWLMELFFLLSGVGAWYALRTRSAATFLGERSKRLLVPVYTVGLLVLMPPQFYLEKVFNAGWSGGFWGSIPRYFERWGPPHFDVFPASLFHLPFSGHLWYIEYLFLVSLGTLPLLLYLRSGRGLRRIDSLARLCERRGGIFVFIVPLALTYVVLRPFFPVDRSWADLLWYAIYFVIGFIIPADTRFTEALKRNGWAGLALWLVGFFGGVGTLALVFRFDPMTGTEPFSVKFVLFQIIYAALSWGSVVFLLSLGVRYLNFNNRALAYGNEAVLPFYLLHQTIILAVGYYVIRLHAGILPKFLIIAVLSFAIIMALYEGLVRRSTVLRFLFGMRVVKRS
jgi:glucan biosynthesis protein C